MASSPFPTAGDRLLVEDSAARPAGPVRRTGDRMGRGGPGL